MNKFSVEMKENLIKKVLTRKGQSIAEIAKLSNVGLSTLSRWVKKSGEESQIIVRKEGSKIYSTAQRLEHLLETAKLTEVELGAYCRSHGLYSFQLTEWKSEFMKLSNEKKDPLARALYTTFF